MKTCVVFALLLSVQAAFAELPRLFCEKEFSVATFAEAVNHFVALGEDAAVRQLLDLALSEDDDFKARVTRLGFSTNERVGWMCRMLFDSKTEQPLRPPAFGVHIDLPYHSMPPERWPRFPIAVSGTTYFVLSEGYSIAGYPERTQRYISYCVSNGVFRKTLVVVPTREQALNDAAALRTGREWLALKWKDSAQGWSYHLSPEGPLRFIQKQVENIQ